MSGRLYFSLFKRKLYVLFSISFLIFFGLNINLAYVSKFGEEGLVVYDYLFTSQSLTLFQIGISILLLILSHLELSRIELQKSASSILMEIVTIPVVLVDQFYFYIHQPIKPWLFENIVFRTLSLHFHMVLKSLVSY